MALGWLTVMKLVPWGEVISNAPKVADGAMKLWNTVAKKPPPADIAGASAQAALTPDPQSISALRAQLSATQAAVADLHKQMLASSELIAALAEQNTQLIKRVETNRVKVLWLAGATLLVGVLAVASLIMTVAR